MNKIVEQLQDRLNHPDISIRLESLRDLVKKIHTGEIKQPHNGKDVNNHIHTTFSFSPYSPTKAIWMAYCAGLATAGIMDHDSVGGVEEFIEAGKIVGIATTIGIECRADFSNTPLRDKRINNPDQKSIAYVAIHGIPHTEINKVKEFFEPYTMERNNRNRKMVERLNQYIGSTGIKLDYGEVEALSMSKYGGSITERHISYGLSKKLIEKFGKGSALLDFLNNQLRISIQPNLVKQLSDENNPFYIYDLLGLIKSELVSSFYIDAYAECPDITEVVHLSKIIGAILAYAYLGDVGNSVTGDKKTQRFEDDYIELLFQVIHQLDFNAVTYMPSRNSISQLEKLRILCDKYGFFQISGEDINSPRQSFICEAMKGDAFQNLIDSTWALIGHEQQATHHKDLGMFSKDTQKKYPDLNERISIFKSIGLGLLST